MGKSNFPHHTVQHKKAAWKGGGGSQLCRQYKILSGDWWRWWWWWGGGSLGEEVLPVGPAHGVPALLNAGKVHEVGGAVHLVVELLRVGQRQLVPDRKETWW